MNRFRLIFAVVAVLLAQPALSDELRPGYLEMRQTSPGTYNLLFKIPARGEDLRLAIYVKLPEGTQDAGPPRASFSDGAYVERRLARHGPVRGARPGRECARGRVAAAPRRRRQRRARTAEERYLEPFERREDQ